MGLPDMGLPDDIEAGPDVSGNRPGGPEDLTSSL